LQAIRNYTSAHSTMSTF